MAHRRPAPGSSGDRQLIGKLTPDRGADLRNLACRGESVEARQQRCVQIRRGIVKSGSGWSSSYRLPWSRSAPVSISARVGSSTNNGMRSARAVICATTAGGKALPATRSASAVPSSVFSFLRCGVRWAVAVRQRQQLADERRLLAAGSALREQSPELF
jgi:hypothetical protein